MCLAQSPEHIRFEQLKVADGLPSNTINQVETDSTGFLWIATDNGLARYDGRHFKTYDSKDFGKGVSSNVTSILWLDKATLWLVIDQQHLLEYRKGCDCFENLNHRFNGELLNYGKGFFRLKKVDNEIWLIGAATFLFASKNHLKHILFTTRAYDYVSLGEDRYFIAELEHMILRFHSDTTFHNYIHGKNLKHEQSLTEGIPANVLHRDQLNRLWTGPWENAVFQYRADDLVPLKKYSLPDFEKAKDTEVYALCSDASNRLWIGTNNHGLHLLNPETAKTYHFNQHNHFPANTYVSHLYQDDQQRIWVATKGDGLFVMNPLRNQGRHYSISDAERTVDVLSIFKLNAENYLIGTSAGLYQFDEQNGFQFLSSSEISVYDIHRLSAGNVLLATNRALLEYDLDHRNIKPFFTWPDTIEKQELNLNELSNTRILDLQEYILPAKETARYDAAGNVYLEKKLALHSDQFALWCNENFKPFIHTLETDTVLIGICYGYGMFVVDLQSRYFDHAAPSKVLSDSKEAIQTNRLNKVVVDPDGGLWLLSEYSGAWLSKGLRINDTLNWYTTAPQVLDYYPALAENYNQYSLKGAGYKNDNFTDLLAVNDSTYLVTTKGGELLQFDFYSKEVEVRYECSIELHGFIKKEGDMVWLASANGFIRFDLSKKEAHSIGQKEGIQYAGSSYLLDGDRLIMGGKNGISIVDRFEEIAIPKPPEEMYLRSVQVMGESLKEAEYGKPLALNYDQNFLAFDFAMIDLAGSSPVEFQYRLNGLHNNWLPSKGSAIYNDLTDGNFKLEVQQLFNGKPLEQNYELFAVSIRPPFWKRTWFIISSALFFILGIYGLFKMRIQRENRLAAIRLNAEIDAQEAERKRLAQELHDDFGMRISALKMYVNTIENLTKVDQPKLKDLSGKAVQLVDDSMSDLRNLLTNLSPNTLGSYGLIAAIKDMVFRLNNVGKINIELESDYPKALLSQKKELNIFRVTQELINNSIKHAECQNIHIEIKHTAAEVQFKYEDDGKGFNLKNQSDGYGLNNIQNRIQLIGGVTSWESKLGKGVRFVFKLSTNNSQV